MPKPPRVIVQLVHIQGPLKGEIQEFSESLIVIGREPECGVRFPGDMVSVSRRHARIVREGNRFKLVDESTNGTFLNGKEVGEAFLTPGDVVTLSEESGPKFSFLMEMSDDMAPPEEAPPPPEPAPETPPPPSEPAEPEAPVAWRPSAPEAGPEPAFHPDPPPSEPSPKSDPKPAPKREPEPEAAPPAPLAGPAPPDDRDIQRVKKPLSVQFGPTLRVFKELPIVVGRHPDCDWEMVHDAILDRHARIFFHGDRYWIKDLTGKASVRVNGRDAGGGLALSAADRIDLAPGGPFFQFMAGGRLLEVDPPSLSPGPSSEDDSGGGAEETGSKKKGGSFLGKWMKR